VTIRRVIVIVLVWRKQSVNCQELTPYPPQTGSQRQRRYFRRLLRNVGREDMKRPLLFLIAAILLSGCAQKTEEERLAKRMSKWRYRTYRLASEKATGAAIAECKRRTGEETDASAVHAVLSVLWFTQQRYELCYLEADLLSEQENEDARVMALALQTVALFGMEFQQLSDARYEELKMLLAATSKKTPEEIQMEHKVFLTCLILVSLHHGDPDLARFSADALGATSQLDYLEPLVGAIVEAKKGHLLKARKELTELVQSDRFQEHTRALIEEASALAEQAEDPEQFLADLLEKLPALLAERVLEDIFAEEKRAGLLQQIKQIPETLMGKEDTQQTDGEATSETAPSAASEASHP
jgi:hypothetical protein